MAILVDPAIWPARGRRFAHLVSDTSEAELHAFAAGLGLERRWFQGDHYDVPAEVRRRAIERGAEPVSAHELVRRLRAAGLRRGSRVRALPGERPGVPAAVSQPAPRS
ncbi:MAG: DUF4031 domain-containing protein [Nitriliruptoraceae bacterium]